MAEREMTFGEKKVQRNFNPSANPIKEGLKAKYADLIDDLEALKDVGETQDVCLSLKLN
jgi:hypothetical protein